LKQIFFSLQRLVVLIVVSAPVLGTVLATTLVTGSAIAQSTTSYEVTPNRGWEGLARVLDAITPSVETEDMPSGQQINAQIAGLISDGKTDAALQKIKEREIVLAQYTGPGRDVQLMFQKARALAQSGQTAEAEKIYRDMTIRYPELAEPWNNLALIYMSRNDLDQALLALQTAVMNNPRYPAALTNLADLRLLMALRDYELAAGLGARDARTRAAELKRFIQSLN
jgi:tetratricopeptide (TPR) repeat protein